ncbi:terminase [Pseudoalteromonas sp. S16_S37]|uniref:terminase n=1 Tax=Pseudoalteromonas sp. S16_S37 TaxID=2720228 RepID=UPI001EEF3E0C|nr:terminase [Pseudoalteromonas sp. S16_S37]
MPAFIFGTVSLISSVISLNILSLIYSMLLMAISIAVQGFGHSKEALPPEPFSSAKNAFIRVFLEQLYTFPKFVITGKWYSALRNHKP